MEDYAIRRKEYVQRVRASFDEADALEGHMHEMEDESEIEGVSPFLFFKMRFICAVFLFLAFLFCQYNNYLIFEQNTVEIIDMITDNQYYTFLQNYVRM